MCDPTLQLVASIGSQIAGAQMQNRATQSANRQMAALMDMNTEKNRGLEDAQAAAIQQATQAVDASAGQPGMEAAGNEISEIFKRAIANAAMANDNPGVSGQGAPRVVQEVDVTAQAEAQAEALARANAISKLDAINSYLTTTVQPKIADSAATGQLTGNFMRGNSNVLDAGMRYANSKAYSPTAQLLTGIGQVGTAYGLYDKNKVIED